MRITQYKTVLNADRHCEVIKEKSMNYPKEKCLDSPQKIYQMLCNIFHHDKQSEEYLYMLCLDIKYKLQGVFEISHGTVNMSVCSPREIFQKALLCNAINIVLAHNHPSGDTTPSSEDILVYKRIKNAGEIMGISLVDNLIIGDNYFSFKENEI